MVPVWWALGVTSQELGLQWAFPADMSVFHRLPQRVTGKTAASRCNSPGWELQAGLVSSCLCSVRLCRFCFVPCGWNNLSLRGWSHAEPNGPFYSITEPQGWSWGPPVYFIFSLAVFQISVAHVGAKKKNHIRELSLGKTNNNVIRSPVPLPWWGLPGFPAGPGPPANAASPFRVILLYEFSFLQNIFLFHERGSFFFHIKKAYIKIRTTDSSLASPLPKGKIK